MSKIKSLKVKQADGTFAAAVPIGADAANIDLTRGQDLETVIAGIESNFDNYYDKTAINGLLEGISTLDIEVVTDLPSSDISTSTIYLKLNASAGANNIYDEYIYVNSQWEIIGSTAIDLSNYYNKSEVDSKLTDKAAASDLTAHTGNTGIHVTATDKSTWSGKQDALVSGTNIKTINNESLLGSGNIALTTEEKEVSIGTTEPVDEDAKIWINPEEEVTSTTLAAVAFSGNYEDLNGKPETIGEVVDNLTSTSTTLPLSANQGKVLNDRLTTVEDNYLTSSTINNITVVSEYPSSLDENTLYLKISS